MGVQRGPQNPGLRENWSLSPPPRGGNGWLCPLFFHRTEGTNFFLPYPRLDLDFQKNIVTERFQVPPGRPSPPSSGNQLNGRWQLRPWAGVGGMVPAGREDLLRGRELCRVTPGHSEVWRAHRPVWGPVRSPCRSRCLWRRSGHSLPLSWVLKT